MLAFSCKTRYFCPSCRQKRVLRYGEWVEENVLAPVPGTLLVEGFRRAVLKFLVKNAVLLEDLRQRMFAWRHAGFSAHNVVRVSAEDIEARKKLAGNMFRAPMSLEKMTYNAATGAVIYRSRMHVGLNATSR